MDLVKRWWNNPLPTGVKIVLLILMANGLPAFVILLTIPQFTERFFVWTINPVINAQLIGVMYGNALLLTGIAAFQKSWARVRIIMVVITLFSILATVLTFFFLKPFLAHPWYHLAFWLTMYLLLFFAAPYFFIKYERQHGGVLPVEVPLTAAARLLAVLALIACILCGIALIFAIDAVNLVLPWTLPPLVGALIGVLFMTHAAAYGWALWDGDWFRVRPIYWQAVPTGFLFFLLPLVHSADLRQEGESNLGLYLVLSGLFVFLFLGVIILYRLREKEAPNNGS